MDGRVAWAGMMGTNKNSRHSMAREDTSPVDGHMRMLWGIGDGEVPVRPGEQ